MDKEVVFPPHGFSPLSSKQKFHALCPRPLILNILISSTSYEGTTVVRRTRGKREPPNKVMLFLPSPTTK
jgi:hypothetical protein